MMGFKTAENTLLIAVFLIKHFICDFPLQRWAYMYVNKGKYGHPGGIVHAIIHGIGTLIVLTIFGLPAFWMAILDSGVHYHIDWAKIKICNVYGLKPDNSEWYWHLLGLDQLIHGLTYVGIIWAIS